LTYHLLILKKLSQEIEDIIGIDASDAVTCSAKTGLGVEDVIERLIRDVPPPEGDPDCPITSIDCRLLVR
jgi:GTP-binding protein LepA